MAKRFDETDSFINTVLTEANWTQANIKVKLNEQDEDTPKDKEEDKSSKEDSEKDSGEKDGENGEEENVWEKNPFVGDKKEESVQLGYDACPLCESSLENDDVIFENIDTHFNNLLAIVDQAQSLEEGEEFDGNLVVEAVAPDGCCPLCESVVEDDTVLLSNMNEHFDVVLEMLDELQEAKEDDEKDEQPKKKPVPKQKPKKA